MKEDSHLDFMPEPEAIAEAKPSRIATNVLNIFAGLLFVGIAWAAFSEIDVIVMAPGRVVSENPTVVLRPLDRTVVKKVCVKVGDRVKKGDTLVEFDPVFGTADEERLANEIRLYEPTFNRLLAESNGVDYRVSNNATKEELWQYQLFTSRKTYFEQKKHYYDQELLRLANTVQQRQSRINLLKKQLKHSRDVTTMLAQTYERRAISSREFKNPQSSSLEIEATLSDSEHELNILRDEIVAKTAEKAAFESQWRMDVSSELVRARENLVSAQTSHEKALRTAAYTKLEAPCDSMVIDVVPIGVGGGINEAENLVTLAPLGGALEVEADVKADDIGYIRAGDSARVKVSTFPFQQHGTILGSVRVISRDSVKVKDASIKGESSVYRARIKLEKGELDKSKLMQRIIPGMEVQSEICVEQRTVLKYLMNPIIKSLSESIREP